MLSPFCTSSCCRSCPRSFSWISLLYRGRYSRSYFIERGLVSTAYLRPHPRLSMLSMFNPSLLLLLLFLFLCLFLLMLVFLSLLFALFQAVFALAASEDFWALLTSVLIQDLSWDTRSRHAGGGSARGPLQGGGERGLNGAQTARLCHTLRCHAIVLEVRSWRSWDVLVGCWGCFTPPTDDDLDHVGHVSVSMASCAAQDLCSTHHHQEIYARPCRSYGFCRAP